MTNQIVTPLSQHEYIAHLTGQRLLSISLVKGGGNNQNFKAIFENNHTLAVKYYPDNEPGKIRLQKEFAALKFLKHYNQSSVPQAIHTDDQCVGIYEWIDGKKLQGITNTEIDQLVIFIQDLNRLSQKPEALSILPATDAIFSAANLLSQIDRRLLRFAPIKNENPVIR